MAAYIMCISSGGGLPIFTRHKGNTENLPFSTVAALNGVHMYGKSQNAELLGTMTDDYVVAWQEFHDSLVFVGISTGCSLGVLNEVLRCTADAVVMIVGIEEIKSQKNIDRLKRELRICYPMIDRLLDSLDSGDVHNKHSSDLADMVEVLLTPENHLIQIVLDSYTECVDSMFSCVLIHGKIAAATESWWSLHPIELKLLSLLATVENTSSSKDIPVFLPYKNPNAAFRFVACALIEDVQVCCLCGPTPTLEEIERSAGQCFRSTMEILEAAVHCHPRNFPHSIELDQEILGFLLINVKKGKYMMSRNLMPYSKKNANSSHRQDILRTFYYQAVKDVLLSKDCDSPHGGKGDADVKSTGIETYWCSEFHKCHAMKIEMEVLCVLYSANTPAQVMRMLTRNVIKSLISDKQFCW